MKKTALILLLLATLASCGNRQRHELPVVEQEEFLPADSLQATDSVALKSEENRVEVKTEAEKSAPQTSSSSSYRSSTSSDDEEYDNMRGFDPASEDDTGDNGLSRYMENNDEEGWD